jgi:uncharacterized protein
MTRATLEVKEATGLALGVNVLRNDALAALAVATVSNASFIRVNVLTGSMFTDQGLIEGNAAEVARSKQMLNPEISVLADVMVKHAVPPAGLTIARAATDTWERGGADALIVSGPATGARIELDEARRIREALPEAKMLVGSGASSSTLGELSAVVDGCIVGSAIKVDGKATHPVDPELAKALVEAASQVGWV